jgi:alpha-tubulin suppressor-like RCC1 family protein
MPDSGHIIRSGPRRRSASTRAAALVTGAVLAGTLSLPASALASQAGRSTAAAAAASAATAGHLWGWGHNDQGQLGDGTLRDHKVPVRVALPAGTLVTSIRTDCGHSVAVTAGGAALAWGFNGDGQLGIGSMVNHRRPVRVHLPKGVKVTAVRAACAFDLALTTTGRVLAWGFGGNGQLGDGSPKLHKAPVFVHLPKNTKVTAISAGGNHSLALTSAGRVLAWGDNSSGQLGDGTTRNRFLPVTVHLPKGTRATSVAGGERHSLAMTSSGLFAWGDNSSSQLGDGTNLDRHTPEHIVVSVPGPSPGRITALAAGCFHSLALTSKGKLLAWGSNLLGQLGDGTTTSRAAPVKVALPAGTKVKSVSAGCTHSLALTTTGHVLAWGNNGHGQLGINSETDSDFPRKVHLAANLRAVAIGSGPDADESFAVTVLQPVA